MEAFKVQSREGDSGSVRLVELDRPFFLSAKDISRLLSCSLAQVRRLQSHEILPNPVRIGELIRWHREEIVHWIERDCPPRPIEPSNSGDDLTEINRMLAMEGGVR